MLSVSCDAYARFPSRIPESLLFAFSRQNQFDYFISLHAAFDLCCGPSELRTYTILIAACVQVCISVGHYYLIISQTTKQ